MEIKLKPLSAFEIAIQGNNSILSRWNVFLFFK